VVRWASVASLLVLAGFLRFYRLDSQLWLDEIAAVLYGYRKSFLEILTTGHASWHPLYQLLAHSSLLLFGESPFAARLPAALFGVGGVLVFYRLARRLFGPGGGLLAGALLAVSYHHIFFSQNARGYSASLFFSLAATDLLLTLLEGVRWRTALAYAAVTSLGSYAHAYGFFVLVGHALVALPAAWWRRRRGDGTAPSPAHLLGVILLTGLITLALYAPLLRESATFGLANAKTAAPGAFGFLQELLEGLRMAFFEWPGVVLAGAVGTIGALDLLRRHPTALAALASPLLVAAGALMVLGARAHPRYFLLVLPVGYLLGTGGLLSVARTVLERGLRLPATRLLQAQWGLGIAGVFLTALPLIPYYAHPKQDHLGALREVRILANGQDRAVAAHLAGHAFRDYYAPDFPVVEDLAELRREEAAGRRVWVVTTLEQELRRHDPDLLTHLRQHYRLVRVLPGTVGDGAMRIYVRDAAASGLDGVVDGR